tara:strand:+ start:597 stop:752 length:156 start_codon:yes stop_codon:yes gene_type:complete
MRQRLVRHGFLPERAVMAGIGKVSVEVPPPVSGLLSAALLFSNFQAGGIGQ